MALDLTNVQHAALAINQTRQIIAAFEAFRDKLNDYAVFVNNNGVGTALSAPGATFPDGFTLTPATANTTVTSMLALKGILDTNVTQTIQNSLNAVRLNAFP